jgi:hypothetical protein
MSDDWFFALLTGFLIGYFADRVFMVSTKKKKGTHENRNAP